MADENKFTHVAVEKPTKRQITLLAAVRGIDIYKLVANWADEDWKRAVKDGLVTRGTLGNNGKKSPTLES